MEVHERIVTDEIKKLVPVLGKETSRKLSRAYLLGDEDVRKRIFELLDAVKAGVFSEKDLQDSILLDIPTDEESEGEINLGTVVYGNKKMYPFGMKKDAFMSHMAIFGSSGYGKTNLSYSLIRNLSDKGVPVIVFDFSKRNYRDLLNTDMKDKIDIYTVGQDIAPLYFNPLMPPEGIQLSQWMKEFTSIFDHAYWLLGGGTHVILKAMEAVFDEKAKPTLSDIKAWLSSYSQTAGTIREKNWVSTAQRPLDSLCFREVGNIFEADVGTQPSAFFKPGRITVLELDALSTNDKSFFIEITLQWIRDWMLVNAKREVMNGVVILEEAHHILNREKSTKLGSETVMDLVFREVRELGLGVIYLDQHPSMMSYPALGNTSTHVYMNLALDTRYSSDVNDACKMLGIDYDENAHYIKQLPVGRGIVISRNSSFRQPFSMDFEFAGVEKGNIKNSDVENHMSGKIVKPKRSEAELNDNELKILGTVARGYGATTSQLYKAAKMSGSTFSSIADSLERKGMISKRSVKAGKTRIFYYYLTDNGEKAAKDAGLADDVESKVDKSRVISLFNDNGWRLELCREPGEGGAERLEFVNNGHTYELVLEERTDRKKIYSDVKMHRHIVCGNEDIKNMVLQSAAKLANEIGAIDLFVSTVEEIQDGKFNLFSF